MLDAKTPCSVTMLPTAAKEPVINPRRHRFDGNVSSPWVLLRRRHERSAAPREDVADLVSKIHVYRDSKERTLSTLGWIDQQIESLEKRLRAATT